MSEEEIDGLQASLGMIKAGTIFGEKRLRPWCCWDNHRASTRDRKILDRSLSSISLYKTGDMACP